MQLQCYGLTAVGGRSSNQDTIAFHQSEDHDWAMAVVADGMGGYNGGEIASEMAVNAIEQGMLVDLEPRRSKSCALLGEQFVVSARIANQDIYERRQAEETLAKMGTTLTAALLCEQQLSLIHIGDSRCYRIRRGELEQISTDHSLVQQMLDDQTIEPNEAEGHPYSHVLTRALGIEQVPEIDHLLLEVEQGDCYLLCSDGFHGLLDSAELLNTLASGEPLETTLQQLMDGCLAKGASDNVSLVVITTE